MKFKAEKTWLLAGVFLVLFSTVASAQTPGVGVDAYTSCNGSLVNIHVSLNVGEVPPTEFVGWVVEREVLGVCVDDVDVGEIRPLPQEIGLHEFVVQDDPTVEGKQIYRIKAVDQDGNRHYIGWPHRGWFTQADCLSDVAAQGTVIEVYGDQLYLEVCPDSCWWELSYFDPIFPPGQELPQVGSVIFVHGKIRGGMEGPFIEATHWTLSPEPCQTVSTERVEWTDVKARYR